MKKVFLSLVVCVMGVLGSKLPAIVYYSCDFENDQANASWVLNPIANQNIASQIVNKWYIGAPGNQAYNGQNGLYISDDEGVTAHYTNKGCWIFAYDSVTLPRSITDYTITFDYRSMGNQASNFDGLYLLWIPVTNAETGDPTKVFSLATGGIIPSVYADYVIPLQPDSYINYVAPSSAWNQCVARIPRNRCNGTPHYLAFVWANTTNTAQQPGAAIDNIMVVDSLCDVPTGLHLSLANDEHTLSWSGNASSYEVTAFIDATQEWFGPYEISDTSYTFVDLPDAQIDFSVRAKCGDGTYSPKATLSQLVYHPDRMCFDYLDFNNAKCYVNNSAPQNTRTFDDFIEVPAVNYGPDNILSRHTIHTDIDEKDPRTGGEAHTMPEGAFASIRLGNWDINNQAERIEYSVVVDTAESSVLLLKYMPVLEAPHHDPEENPRMKLEVFIDDSISVETCAKADFNADDVIYDYGFGSLKPEAEAQGWHLTPYNGIFDPNTKIVWKEWTTVGVNLNKPQYEGRTMTIRLTTLDCTLGAHSGYMYFTLDCTVGKLKMQQNGADYEFTAPEGFVYRWYRVSDNGSHNVKKVVPENKILSHEQSFTINADDGETYAVDCMFVQDSTNYFTLYAKVPQETEGLANTYLNTSFPSVVLPSQTIPIELNTPMQVHFITMTGMYCYEEKLSSGEGIITAPSVPGMYIIEFISSDGERFAQPLSVQYR